MSSIEFRAPLPLAEPLQVSITKAGRLLLAGELDSVGRGRGLRITIASIRAFQERHRNELV